MQSNSGKSGLLMVYTGDGKGKTTAALGQMVRAKGWHLKVVMFQFIKRTRAAAGEHRAARELGLDIRPLGTGFTWNARDKTKARDAAREQWRRCQEAMLSDQFDMIVLDEVSHPVNCGWIRLAQVVDAIQSRPPRLHVLLTGRKMPAQLQEMADLVTEMKEVKHPYQKGVKAQKGIEF